MKKVFGILVGLLVLGAIVGSVVAMPWWFHNNGFAVQKPKFGYMHGYGFAQGYSEPIFVPGPKFGYGCPMMWGYTWRYAAPQQEIDFDEIKDKVKEILKDSEVKNGYIVRDNIVYGFLYENVSLAEVELGTPLIMMWFTTIPLEKDNKVVGFLRVSNFELFGDSASRT